MLNAPVARRGLFKLGMGAAVSGKTVAKLVSKAAMDSAGLSVGPVSVSNLSMGMGAGMPSVGFEATRALKAYRSLKAGKLEESYENELVMRDARVLDPDIAALQSVSLTIKYRMQFDRALQARVQGNIRSLLKNAAEYAGIDLELLAATMPE